MPGGKGGVNEGLGEGAYGRVRGEGVGGGKGVEERGVPGRDARLPWCQRRRRWKQTRGQSRDRVDSQPVFSSTNEGQSGTNMSACFEL